MNLNPIGEKLAKMFGKKKKKYYSTSTMEGSIYNSPSLSQIIFLDDPQPSEAKTDMKTLQK